MIVDCFYNDDAIDVFFDAAVDIIKGKDRRKIKL